MAAARTPRGRSSNAPGAGRTSGRAAGGRASGRPKDPEAEIAKLLKKGTKEWGKSKDEVANIGADNRVPASTYEVKLVKLTLIAKDDKLSLMRKHMVTDGEYEGDTVTDFMRFQSKDSTISMAYIRRYFETLEVEIPEDPTELPPLVKELTDEGYEGKLRVWYTKGESRDFLNAQLLEAYPPVDEGGAGSETVDGGDDSGATGPAEAAQVDEEAAASAEATTEGDDGSKSLDDMDKAELVALIKEENIPIKGVTRKSVDKLREEIRAHDDAQEGDEAAPAAEAAAPAEPDTDTEDRKALAVFCKAQGLADVNADNSVDELCKEIGKYEYDRPKLDKEDIELLESFKLGDVIVDPEPEPPKPAARRPRR
jgi:hypothetical protein